MGLETIITRDAGGIGCHSNMLGGHRGVVSGRTNILGCYMDGVG